MSFYFLFFIFEVWKRNWWCRKVHQWDARSLRSNSHLQKRRKYEHLTEGTGVEPAKHPPKVKSEVFSQL